MTLLNIPGFIERLCKLATRKVSEATGANFLQELEDWYTWLDNALVLDALMQMATEEAEQSSTGEPPAPPETGRGCADGRASASRVVGRELGGHQPPAASAAPVHEDRARDHV